MSRSGRTGKVLTETAVFLLELMAEVDQRSVQKSCLAPQYRNYRPPPRLLESGNNQLRRGDYLGAMKVATISVTIDTVQCMLL